MGEVSRARDTKLDRDVAPKGLVAGRVVDRCAVMVLFAIAAAACAQPETVHPLTQPWEQAVPVQSIPDGLETLRASECGQCHTDIYDEWSQSIHAHAVSDVQFQAEWRKDEYSFVCRNCHMPLQNQQETVVTGLIEGDYQRPVEIVNTSFDAGLQAEAITCAACHVRDGWVIGPDPEATAPHALRTDAELLSSSICLGCHNVQGELSPTLVCTFATGDEWRRSPCAAEGRDCVSCHMPEVMRPNVRGGPLRHSSQHTWIGAGIPKTTDVPAPLASFESGLDISVTPSQETFRAGEAAGFTVEVMNARAGHEMPTGDVERFITVDMQIVGAGGTVVASRRERIGELWEWWPEARQVSDNSLRPLETRRFELEYSIPDDASSQRFIVAVTNHRMTEENALAMGVLGTYPLSAEIFRVEYPLDQP